jgi:hypothetical protein
MADNEIDAMGSVLKALTPLDDASRLRAVRWALEKLGTVGFDAPRAAMSSSASSTPTPVGSVPTNFRDLADLFDAANPETDVERALVAGYWNQVCQNQPSFGAQSVNDDLKQLGHAIGNITRAMDNLMLVKPALAQQLRKDGGTKQARKTYRLTAAGIRRIEAMLRGQPSITNE